MPIRLRRGAATGPAANRLRQGGNGTGGRRGRFFGDGTGGDTGGRRRPDGEGDRPGERGLRAFKERENVSYVNSVCSFFTSYYERPEDLDLVEFLRYMGIGGTVEDEAEFQALKGAGGWPFQGVDSLDRMPVPIHRYRRTELDAYLEEHADITTADLTNVPESSGELVYLPETDAFYNFTSDAGPGMFICEAGRWEGKLLVLTGGGKELTLEAAEDGRYLFRSFLPLEEAEI